MSIVIPTFNRGELLDHAVASVTNQTMADLEVVVVNDGGSAVGRFVDPRVRVIDRPSSGGAATARNTGIAAARGRYITFLDDDDEFTPSRLALGMRGITEAPISLCWKAHLGSGEIEWSRRLSGSDPDTLMSAPVPQMGSTLVDARLVVRQDESFSVSEDVEWWVRMSLVAPVHTVPEVGYLIRDHAGPRLRDRVATRLEHRLRLLDMHEQFFSDHHNAAAYHWKRAAGLAATTGDRALAVQCFHRAFTARPSVRTVGSGVRTVLRGSR